MDDRKVYTNTLDYAREHGELESWRESGKLNQECAAAIDKAISESNYEQYRYDLPGAVEAVSKDFGLDRVAWVMAGVVQAHDYDGRYSDAHKRWAREFDVPEDTRQFGFQSHATVLDGFVGRVREALADREVARGIVPLDPHGYSAKFAETLLDGMEDARHRTLFSAEEKNLVCNYAYHTGDATKTRQLAEELARGGESTNLAVAQRVNAEIAAIDEDWERQDARSPIAAVEMSTEQNLNQIDGLRNNMAVPPADLTDGQTHEELRELAPETLPKEKPSVLGRLKEAREQAPHEHDASKHAKGKEDFSR